jgi:2-polyprenyl-6-methoxyphenol hydroxylase-like FAD-dependent oxidoreductase
MNTAYDAIIVGARCAGSPTALLLARKGYRVLVVDRATFPSDTVSTHVVHPMGVAALARWGLIDRLTATGCPPIHTYDFDFGRYPGRRARTTLQSRTAPGGRSSTNCSSTQRPKPVQRFEKASPSRRS